MIFVTVGHELPFDRLIRCVDQWAERCDRSDVFAQIGKAGFRPRRIQSVEFLDPAEFRVRLKAATAVVAHAGMGTIIQALDYEKPLLVFPRLARLRETRTDHQLSTARHFAAHGRLLAALSEEELSEQLDRIEAFRPGSGDYAVRRASLLQRIRAYVDE